MAAWPQISIGHPPSRSIGDRVVRPVLRISEVTDGERAFVEWWATFGRDSDQRAELTAALERSFGRWLESLRDAMAA
jgi:hypothetical protein